MTILCCSPARDAQRWGLQGRGGCHISMQLGTSEGSKHLTLVLTGLEQPRHPNITHTAPGFACVGCQPEFPSLLSNAFLLARAESSSELSPFHAPGFRGCSLLLNLASSYNNRFAHGCHIFDPLVLRSISAASFVHKSSVYI